LKACFVILNDSEQLMSVTDRQTDIHDTFSYETPPFLNYVARHTTV